MALLNEILLSFDCILAKAFLLSIQSNVSKLHKFFSQNSLLETWCPMQMEKMLFIAKSKDQTLFKPPSIANTSHTRGKLSHQLVPICLAMEKSEGKQFDGTGYRRLLQVGSLKFSTIIIAIPMGGFRVINEVYASAAWRKQMPLMQEFEAMKIKKIVRS